VLSSINCMMPRMVVWAAPPMLQVQHRLLLLLQLQYETRLCVHACVYVWYVHSCAGASLLIVVGCFLIIELWPTDTVVLRNAHSFLVDVQFSMLITSVSNDALVIHRAKGSCGRRHRLKATESTASGQCASCFT
jgi:hypothetical protein